MSLKLKPPAKGQTLNPTSKPLGVTSPDAKGVAGMGVYQGSSVLAYPMVLLLKKFLVTLKRGEQVLEAQRQKLAALPEFEPHAAFQRINRTQDGIITSVDILKFLRQNGVDEANESDCHAIIKYFDGQGGDSLHFNDFLQLMMPCDSPALRSDIACRPNFLVPNGEYLGPRVESELACLFEKEIALNRVLEEQKQTMECSKQFNYDKAFAEIDDWSYGFIDKKNLKSFLRKHGCHPTSKDVMSIIRRMDLDGDARISKDEFINSLVPEEPYSKILKRAKEKERSHSRFGEKISKQGEKQLHQQDVVLNLFHGQRDDIRTQAQDRGFSTSKFKNMRSYGNVGSSALKIRPDLNRMDQGFYLKEPEYSHASRKKKVQNITTNTLMLPRKYNEHMKENFYKKLQKGKIPDDFKQDRVWRPGGKSIKVKTQREADVSLIQTGLRKSTSQMSRFKQPKKMKRIKSAGGNRNRLDARNVQQARTAVQQSRKFEFEGNASINQYKRRFKEAPTPNIFERSRFENEDLVQTPQEDQRLKFSDYQQEYSITKQRAYDVSGADLNTRNPDQSQLSQPDDYNVPNMLSYHSLKKDYDYENRSKSPNSISRNAPLRTKSRQGQQQDEFSASTFHPMKNGESQKGFEYNVDNGSPDLPQFYNQEEPQRRRDREYEELSDHIQKSQERLRTKLLPKEQALSQSPPESENNESRSRSPFAQNNAVAPIRPAIGINEYNPNQYVGRLQGMSPLRSQGKSFQTQNDPRYAPVDPRPPMRFDIAPLSYEEQVIDPYIRGQPGLSSSDTAAFVECLIELVNLTRKLESTRMDLACMTDFNLMDAFSIFDVQGNGKCSQDVFRTKLGDLGLVPKPERREIQAIFRRYNKADDGFLKYSEFMHAITPMSEVYADMLRQRKVGKNVYNQQKLAITMFQSDTYANFLRVLEALVATEMGTEAIRHQLKQRKSFSGSSAFLSICKNRRPERSDLDYQSPVIPEFITHRHIMDLMQRYGHKDNIEELDVHLIVDRFDKDGDGVIGFSEFCELLEPFY